MNQVEMGISSNQDVSNVQRLHILIKMFFNQRAQSAINHARAHSRAPARGVLEVLKASARRARKCARRAKNARWCAKVARGAHENARPALAVLRDISHAEMQRAPSLSGSGAAPQMKHLCDLCLSAPLRETKIESVSLRETKSPLQAACRGL